MRINIYQTILATTLLFLTGLKLKTNIKLTMSIKEIKP